MTPAEISRMFSRISARYDLANRVLSFRLDRRWRRRLVRWANPQPAEKILDVCTGTADLLLEFCLHHREERLHLWGLDLSRDMLTLAQKKLRSHGGTYETLLIEGDALQLPFPSGSLDLVTVGFGLRNLPELHSGLVEIVRVLKPGGRLFLLEFALPENSLWRSFYLFYLRHVVPRLGALITGSRDAYEYLYRSIREFPLPQAILQQLELVELVRTECLSLAGGIAVIYRGERAAH
jgi:demethylmenaquinone methyltransferase/2-methoxy-6-polyprenyl-1,4-benzoquinol methylase